MFEALRDAPRIGARLPIELPHVQMAEERFGVASDRFGFVEDLWEREVLVVHSCQRGSSIAIRSGNGKEQRFFVRFRHQVVFEVSLATMAPMMASAFAAISCGV